MPSSWLKVCRTTVQITDWSLTKLSIKALDVHRDTPVEILHTYLLGVDKYSWFHLHDDWSDTQKGVFAVRLQSSSLHGLSLPALRAQWMMQHPNNLIGKHLKALQQLTIFQLDDNLCDDLVFDLWRATGELGAVLWFHEIEDRRSYLVSCSAHSQFIHIDRLLAAVTNICRPTSRSLLGTS